MTSLDHTRERPEFDAIDLEVDADTVHQHVEAEIKGLSTSTTDEGVKYRTTDGMLVAIVESRQPAGDEVGTTLRYRTGPAVESATRKASKIRDALQPHAVDT